MMSRKNPSFSRQTAVLTKRYFNIFLNNKKTMLMDIVIPLITMIIVAVVSCVNMYVDKDKKYTEINEGYPVLSWETSEKSDVSKWDGNVSQSPRLYTTKIDDEEYYVVNEIADLAAVMMQGGDWLNRNYCLGKDINLDNHEWTPIGKNKETPFTGKFEGNGHIITNLKITKKNDYSGFFGYIKGAEIRNLGIDGGEINSAAKGAGTISGCMEHSIVKECFVKKIKLSSKSDVFIGGISGHAMNKSKISTSYSRVHISGNNSGLIVAENQNSKIQYCYEAGKINDSSVFNLVGTNKSNENQSISKTKIKESASTVGKSGIGFRNDSSLSERKATQIGLFMIICVAIFVGICNSIQEIVKERNILKREYMSNLRLGSYVASKLIVQAVICAVQSLIITIIFYIAVSGREYPVGGIVTPWAHIDFYITVFLVTFAADVTALFISSIVKSSVMANTFIPIILIVQIIYSGVLFELGKIGDMFASFMISKWGVASLSAISYLNESRPELLINNPEYEQSLGEELLTTEMINSSNFGNVIKIWGILIVFIVVFTVASRVSLNGIKKDKR